MLGRLLRAGRWGNSAVERCSTSARTLATLVHGIEATPKHGMAPPLEGVKVLDFTSALSGPSATLYLGDLGADVWKLEVPKKGDDTRHWGPPFLKHKADAPERWSDLDFESSFYASTNRNKRSLTVDLKKPQGRDIAVKLAVQADVIVENLITGKLANMGLGYEDIKRVNPGIVYCSITGYGQTGSYATAPGYDAILAGEAGVIHCTGEPDRLPVRPQVALADHAAGFNAYGAILAGLMWRKKNGKGCHIDVSMFDCQVAALANASSQWLNLGIEYQRMSSASPLATPDELFHTSNGLLALSIFTDEEFSSFASAVNRPELAGDQRFGTAMARLEHRAELVEALEDIFCHTTTEEWISELSGRGFAIAPVRNLKSMYSHPLVSEAGLVSDIPHPYVGTVRVANPPVLYNGQRMKTRYPPPTLGAHTREILEEELNLSPLVIAELRAQTVI